MCDFLDRLDDRRLEVEYGPGSVTNGVEAIDKTSDEAVAAGFLRPVDAELIKSRARTSPLLAAQPVGEQIDLPPLSADCQRQIDQVNADTVADEKDQRAQFVDIADIHRDVGNAQGHKHHDRCGDAV